MPVIASRGNSPAVAFGFGSAVDVPEILGGMVLMTPTSATGTGSSATIGTNGSVTFSSCVTLSLNGVFNTDYDNYMIVIRQDLNTVDNMVIRLRSSGTDATGSNYTRQTLFANSTAVTAGRATESSAIVNAGYNVQRIGTTIHMFGPFLSQPTAIRSANAMDSSSAGIYDIVSTHSLSTSYDGFTLFAQGGAGVFNGRVSVCGLVGT
jgi:phosphate-selective porin